MPVNYSSRFSVFLKLNAMTVGSVVDNNYALSNTPYGITMHYILQCLLQYHNKWLTNQVIPTLQWPKLRAILVHMYKRQIAVAKSFHWSQINGTLYSLCFTGKGQKNATYIHCLGDNHVLNRCPDTPAPTNKNRASTKELCQLPNVSGGSQCRYKACNYLTFLSDLVAQLIHHQRTHIHL